MAPSAAKVFVSYDRADRNLGLNGVAGGDPGKGSGPRKGVASIQYTKRDVEVGETASFGETKFCGVSLLRTNPLSISQTSSPLTPICVMCNV
jgi:hypothetical protein